MSEKCQQFVKQIKWIVKQILGMIGRIGGH